MTPSDFGQLMVFHEIVQEQSISKAAQKLSITTPSVSKALKNLEHKIGTPLFIRSTRRLILTEAGEQLWQQTKPAIASLQQTWQQIGDSHQAPCGNIRITLSQAHFEMIFKPIYAQFIQQYPQIKLEFSINNATIDLHEHHFDFGVRFGDKLTENVVAKAIYPPIRQGLYVSAHYAQTHGIPQTPAQLSTHQLIGFRFGSSNKIEPLSLHINDERIIQPIEYALLFNDTEQVIDATLQGLGIGRIFEPVAQRHQALIPVLPEYWLNFPASYLYFLPNLYKAKKLQLLIDFLLKQYNKAV